jgi:cytochrome b561
MQLRNTRDRYGWVGIGFHWLVALTIFGLFGVGLYMIDLTYYSPLYKTLPDWHRSIGLTLAAVVVLRLFWRWWTPIPRPHAEHSRLERTAAAVVHLILYLLIFAMIASGYLISTAKGQGIDVFGWFQVPSITGEVEDMEDWAGVVHYWIAWTLMGLTGLHAAGALKHHFIDRDDTLLRILRSRPKR